MSHALIFGAVAATWTIGALLIAAAWALIARAMKR